MVAIPIFAVLVCSSSAIRLTDTKNKKQTEPKPFNQRDPAKWEMFAWYDNTHRLPQDKAMFCYEIEAARSMPTNMTGAEYVKQCMEPHSFTAYLSTWGMRETMPWFGWTGPPNEVFKSGLQGSTCASVGYPENAVKKAGWVSEKSLYTKAHVYVDSFSPERFNDLEMPDGKYRHYLMEWILQVCANEVVLSKCFPDWVDDGTCWWARYELPKCATATKPGYCGAPAEAAPDKYQAPTTWESHSPVVAAQLDAEVTTLHTQNLTHIRTAHGYVARGVLSGHPSLHVSHHRRRESHLNHHHHHHHHSMTDSSLVEQPNEAQQMHDDSMMERL